MNCPICGEETIHTFRPFCSKRCADIDLAKWLNGSYAVPSQREEDADGDLPNDETEPPRRH
ncbi:MAG: DNA gyrase inhibitor YacG [Pseudomonadota bacterium]